MKTSNAMTPPQISKMKRTQGQRNLLDLVNGRPDSRRPSPLLVLASRCRLAPWNVEEEDGISDDVMHPINLVVEADVVDGVKDANEVDEVDVIEEVVHKMFL